MKSRVLLKGQALEEYNKLKSIIKEEKANGINSSEKQSLFRSIETKKEWLKDNPLSGEVIKKEDIPKNLDVDNLFKIRLSGFWRMLYTIRRESIEIFCFILILESHPDYNKRFGKRKKNFR
jgi:hypothetical protein